MESIVELLNNDNFVWGAMTIVVLCLSQLLKLPIKVFTSKIADEKVRKAVNTTIMLIPIALGILCDFAYCTYYLGVTFSLVEGVKIGASANVLYGVLERLIWGKTSESTDKTRDFADDILEDGKVDKTDLTAVERFYNQGK